LVALSTCFASNSNWSKTLRDNAATLMRGLAIVAAIHLSWLLLYHLPAGLLAIQAPQRPKQIEKLSHFTSGTCGAAVDRACPGPNTPIGRPGAYINYEGALVR
jgi:hypothetical protein